MVGLYLNWHRVIMVLGPSCRIWEDENGGGQTEAVPLEMVEIKSEIILKNVLVSPQIKILLQPEAK